jgi:hypothetical protein
LGREDLYIAAISKKVLPILLLEVFSGLRHNKHIGLHRPDKVVDVLVMIADSNDVYSAKRREDLKPVIEPIKGAIRPLALPCKLVGINADNENIAVALGCFEIALVADMEEVIDALSEDDAIARELQCINYRLKHFPVWDIPIFKALTVADNILDEL